MLRLFKNLTTTNKVKNIDFTICSPLAGTVTNLSEVNDPVFAKEVMGKGIAIIPTVGRVVAPCSGSVINVFRTLHAITIKADNGAEIIIHVGLETVSLGGKHYEIHVQDEMRIKKGDLLLTFDIDAIKALGYDIITPIVITNSTEFHKIENVSKKIINFGDLLINLA